MNSAQSIYTKRNLLEFVLSTDSLPTHSNFSKLCSSWIYELFPQANSDQVTKFLKSYCQKVRKLWRSYQCGPNTVNLLTYSRKHNDFFNELIHFNELPDPEPVFEQQMETDEPLGHFKATQSMYKYCIVS